LVPFLLTFLVFPWFALHEEPGRARQKRKPDHDPQVIDIGGKACRNEDKRDQKQCNCLRLSGISSHRSPRILFVFFGRAAQRAVSPRSSFRIRTASATSKMKFLPSPILPVRAAPDNADTTSSA